MIVDWFRLSNVSISLKHGLELISVMFYLCCHCFAYAIIVSLIYFLYAGNIYSRSICVLHLVYMYITWNMKGTGRSGVGIHWMRNLAIWRHCINYFPIDLVKIVDLPADRNYLICIFPHGLHSYGAGMNFASNHSKWSKLFPGVRPKLTTFDLNVWHPFLRELVLGCGACSASEKSLRWLLSQSNDPAHEANQDGYTSNGVGLIVGGAHEMLFTQPNTYRCAIKNRRGFVRIALELGVPLVPAISFGENNLHDAIEIKTDSFWYRLIKKPYLPLLLNGRFGWVPKRHPITTVIGEPIFLEKTPKPTREQIEQTYELFCAQLNELFESQKCKYIEDCEHIHLEIV